MAAFNKIAVLIWADYVALYVLWDMATYLTDVWGLDWTHAAAIVNILMGVVTILPIGMAFIVDTFMGDYYMLLIATLSYSFGLSYLAMSTPPVLSKVAGNCSAYEPECIGSTQKVLFYTALPLIAVGISGRVTSLEPFHDVQLESPNELDDLVTELLRGACVKCLSLIILLLLCFAYPLITSWSVWYGIPAICMTVATLYFLCGSSSYVDKEPQGSPITTLFRVPADYASKIFKWRPSNASNEQQEYHRLEHSSTMEVEETKDAIRIITMCIAFVMCGFMIAMGNTFFMEQANNMNCKLGSWSFPLQYFLFVYGSAAMLFAHLFKKWVKDVKYAPSIGFIVTMVISILCCITAAIVENRRLDAIEELSSMSVFWLLPQFVLLGGLNGISDHSIACLFRRRGLLSEGRYPKVFSFSIVGIGIMCTVLSVYIIKKVTGEGEKTSWFQDTLNESRLDKYYWALAVLSCINLVLFIFVAIWDAYEESKSNNGIVEDDLAILQERLNEWISVSRR